MTEKKLELKCALRQRENETIESVLIDLCIAVENQEGTTIDKAEVEIIGLVEEMKTNKDTVSDCCANAYDSGYNHAIDDVIAKLKGKQ